MSQPSDDTVAQLKAQFPDRSLHLVTKKSPDDDSVSFDFVMTGPSRDELDYFDDKLLKASEAKTQADKKKAIRSAIEEAALAQIRWPSREEAKKILAAHSEMVYSFSDDLRNFAGASFETRSKKL